MSTVLSHVRPAQFPLDTLWPVAQVNGFAVSEPNNAKPLSQDQAGIKGNTLTDSELKGHAFKVAGNAKEQTQFFKENYDATQFQQNYDQVEHPESANGPVNFVINNCPTGSLQGDKAKCLRNMSRINYTGQERGQWGGMLKRNKFDTQNGKMTVNIYWEQESDNKQGTAGQTFLFFRYYDDKNYYVVQLNNPQTEIYLYKMVNGQLFQIAKYDEPGFKFNIWYTFHIIF